MELTDVIIDANVTWQNKKTKWCLVQKILF